MKEEAFRGAVEGLHGIAHILPDQRVLHFPPSRTIISLLSLHSMEISLTELLISMKYVNL